MRSNAPPRGAYFEVQNTPQNEPQNSVQNEPQIQPQSTRLRRLKPSPKKRSRIERGDQSAFDKKIRFCTRIENEKSRKRTLDRAVILSNSIEFYRILSNSVKFCRIL